MKRLILFLIAVTAWLAIFLFALTTWSGAAYGQIPAPGGSSGGGGGGTVNSCANLGDGAYYSGATTLSCPATSGVGYIYNSTTNGVTIRSGVDGTGEGQALLLSTQTGTGTNLDAGDVNIFPGNCTVGGSGVGGFINLTPGNCATGTPGVTTVTASNAASNILLLKNSVGATVCTVGPTGALTGACAPAAGATLTGTPNQIPYVSTTNAALTGATGMTWNTGLSPMIVGPAASFTAASTSASFGHYISNFTVTNGTPDTFVWAIDGGSDSAPVNVTGASQTLSDGFSVTFPGTTGNIDDTWYIVPVPGVRMTEGERLWIGEMPAVLANNPDFYPVPNVMVSDTGTSRAAVGGQSSFFIGNGTGYDEVYYSSNGTPAAPTALTTGNVINYRIYSGYTTFGYLTAGSDITYTDTGTIGFPFPGAHCIDGGKAGLHMRFSGNIGVLNQNAPCATLGEDLGFRRSAAGVLEVNNGTIGTVASINVSGVRYNGVVPASSAIDFGSIADGACADNTFTLTGAAANDKLAQSWPAALTSGLHGTMFVSAADTVTVRLCNLSGGAVDLASSTFGAAVVR